MRASLFLCLCVTSTTACSGGNSAAGGDSSPTLLAGAGGAGGSSAGASSGKGGSAGAGASAGAGKGGSSQGGTAGGPAGGAAGGSGAAGIGGTGGGMGGTGGSSGGGGKSGAAGGSSGASGTGGAGGKSGAAGATGGSGGVGGATGGSGGSGGGCNLLRIGIIGVPGANPSSDFQAFVKALGTSTMRVNTMTTDTFDANLLAGFDVVILDELVRPYTAAEATALRTWVEGGGGFVSMSGYTGAAAPDWYANALLAPYGLSYGGGLLNGPATTFVPHPTTMGLTSVTFAGGYEVTTTPVAGGTSTAVAAIGSTWVGYVHQRSMGRGFVWGDEWIEFDSEWQAMPEIKQLWVNVLTWVASSGHCALKPLGGLRSE